MLERRGFLATLLALVAWPFARKTKADVWKRDDKPVIAMVDVANETKIVLPDGYGMSVGGRLFFGPIKLITRTLSGRLPSGLCCARSGRVFVELMSELAGHLTGDRVVMGFEAWHSFDDEGCVFIKLRLPRTVVVPTNLNPSEIERILRQMCRTIRIEASEDPDYLRAIFDQRSFSERLPMG